MTDPERHLMTIFSAALDRESPAERAVYLDAACGPDADLRQRVDALLAANEHAGEFLERRGTAAFDAAGQTADAPGPRAGAVIAGRYKLLEMIGEGGMGEVWLAEQTEPVRRQVALKLIKPGLDSRQVLARFEAERQALALMDHPNIAKVLDGGAAPDGRPFFVMELVKGTPITRYCDDHHLTPRERLELFVPVCQAVQHAHQKGIIHRDLKPSNVMVAPFDGRPVVKVIDFGVAKAAGQRLTEKTLFTGLGAVVGTLEYMSPEQAELNNQDIDTRSDIFTLGVLLYELLTGTTPLTHKRIKEAAFVEVLRVIREEEPPKPSTRLSNSKDSLPSISANRHMEPAKLTKLVKGELDWIVMKALEKDRNRRYETANGFAADVQRYLADEPVQACPPSVGYRLAKFVRRNKVPVIAAALLFLALVAGVVGTSFGLMRAVNAKREAERNLEQALKAADTFFTRVSQNKLLDKPALQPFRKELLEEAQKQYLELFNKKPDDPKLTAELGASYLRMVMVLTALEEGPKAVQALEKGLDLIEPLVNEHPGDRELATRLAGVCTAERPMYRPWLDGFSRCNVTSGLKVLERACDLWKKLADDYPGIPELEADYATFLMYQGDVYYQLERHRECQRLYEAADARFTKLARGSFLSCEYRIHAAIARMGIAVHLSWFGQERESFEAYMECARMFEDLLHEFRDKPILQFGILGAQAGMVDSLKNLGRPEDAEALRNRIIQSAEELHDAHPDVPAHAAVLAYLYSERISAEESKRRMPAAEATFRKSLAFLDKSAAYYPDHPGFQASLASEYGVLGMFRLRRGDAERAFLLIQQAISLLEKLGPDAADDPSVVFELGRLYLQKAWIHRDQSRLEDAEKAYRAAIAYQSRFSRISLRRLYFTPDLYGSCATLINLLRSTGRSREADDFIRQTIADWEKLARDDPEKYEFQLHVAQSYALAGKWNRAVEEYGKAISKWPHQTDPWRGRASAYSSLGKHEQAVRDYTTLIEFGYRDPAAHSWMYEARANAYRALKQDDKALADLTSATEQWPFLLDPWMWRANLYRDLGQWQNAIDDCSKAIALKPEHLPAWQARGSAYVALKQEDKALADMTEATKRWPDLADTWIWRGNFHRDRQQWTKAIADYSEALALNPKYQPVWQARGTAQYRAGDWEGAILSLTKSAALPKGGDAHDWFYLGMSQWKLDQKEKARQSYDRAVQWMENHSAQREELRPLRAEAAKLLWLGEKKD